MAVAQVARNVLRSVLRNVLTNTVPIGAAVVGLLVLAVSPHVPLSAQGPAAPPQGRAGGPPAPPPTARAAALADFTGQWVSLITEDWRHRQFAAPKGDAVGLPLNPNGQKTAAAWDPARDEAAGEQCKAYGAAGVMRLPTRLRISWQDDTTLKIDTDAGTQTRLLKFGAPAGEAGSWQGVSVASWEFPRPVVAARGPAPGPVGGPPTGGSMRVVTRQMRPGYLRRNGVPYGANAVMTEFFDRLDVPGGDALLVVAAEVADPEHLATPYWTSVQFKRQADQSGWNPTPCAVR